MPNQSFVFKLSVMKVKWKKLLLKTSTWLVLEVSLNYVGLDTLAAYSEFVFERTLIVLNS
jgi:hypothetical protein